MTFTKSEELFERGGTLIPAGVNSNTRARAPHPLYFSSADGPRVTDADGNVFNDILMGNGAILLGHNHPEVQDAVRTALTTGLTTGVESAATVGLAERFLGIVKTMDRVRFTNTGTEAVLHALRLARYATGRTRIAKPEGSYHGWSDEAFVSVWADLRNAGPADDIRSLAGTPGQRQEAVDDVIVLPFNDVERSLAVIDRHAHELAAIILEPILIDIGFIPASGAYLKALRVACDKHNIVLIYDELLTGFNVAPGGVQGITGIVPDLATYGKALGNGYPIAALAGRADLMTMLEPGKGPVFVGTFNGHAISVAAANASLSLLADGSVQRNVSHNVGVLKGRFEAAAKRLGVEAQMLAGGSHFQWYFTAEEIVDYRTAATTNAPSYGAFVQSVFRDKTLFLPNPLSHHAVSLAHDEEMVGNLADIFERGLQAVAAAHSG